MKLFIISDVHGKKKELSNLITYFLDNDFDYFIILGDIYHGYGAWFETADARDIANELSRVVPKLVLLKGNCDNMSDEDFSPVGLFDNFSLMLNGHHIYFTHGNRYFPYGILTPGDIYCHGHTHINMIKKSEQGYIECNPGSISFPRGNSVASYMIISNEDISIYNLNHDLINKYKFK